MAMTKNKAVHTGSVSKTPKGTRRNITLDIMSIVSTSLLIATNSIDPGNLKADLEQASLSGKRNLFVLIISGMFGITIYIMTILLVIKSGMGISKLIRKRYPQSINYFIYSP